MGETVHWDPNCLRTFKLSKLVNGKESILTQFFKAIFVSEEEHGVENPPQEPTIHKKYSEMSLDMPDSPPPPTPQCWQEAKSANNCMINPCPRWGLQLSKAVSSKPVPTTGPPAQY